MRFAVVGGGAWGTALGSHLARSGHAVRLWLRDASRAAAINERHENAVYLPGVPLPKELAATADLKTAVAEAETILVAVPSEFCREIYRRLHAVAPADAVLVSATKGIEIGTWRRMTEVAADVAPGHPLAVLSGPSFALEVAAGQPTAVVVAAPDLGRAEVLQRALSTRAFRAYSTDDLVGVELAGALKNVIAIAAGIVDGLGYGQNTIAALVTRGLAEVTRLAVAHGGRADTLAGLAGLGDLVLTCNGGLSRNRRLGQALGRGLTLEQAQREVVTIAEGLRATLGASALAEARGVEMPITREMRSVLYDAKSPREAVDSLMSRNLKRE